MGWLLFAMMLCGCGADGPADPGVAAGGTAAQGSGGDTGAGPASGGSGTGGSVATGSTASTGGSAPSGGASGGAVFGTGGTGANTGGVSTPTGGGGAGGVSTPTGGVGTGGVSTPTGGAGTGGVSTPTGGEGTGGAAIPTGGLGTGGVATGGVPGSTGGTVTDPQGMTLYYVRHAQTVANAQDNHEPTLEDADTLTELGMRQVDDLTAYLTGSGISFDAVLVSPALRSQRTIEPYLVASGLTGVVWPELWECCGSEPNGDPLPTEPVRYDFFKVSVEAQNMALREGDPGTFWQVDTYEQGLFMVMQARDALLRGFGQSGKTVLISGHAISGGIMIGLLRGMDLSGGLEQTGPNAVYMLNTGIQLLIQDPTTGVFELEDSNINDPVWE